jgi:hypothetical protein
MNKGFSFKLSPALAASSMKVSGLEKDLNGVELLHLLLSFGIGRLLLVGSESHAAR